MELVLRYFDVYVKELDRLVLVVELVIIWVGRRNKLTDRLGSWGDGERLDERSEHEARLAAELARLLEADEVVYEGWVYRRPVGPASDGQKRIGSD